MIRINLVAPERAAKARPRPRDRRATPGALQSYLLLALFAGGALVLCAGLWWFQSAQLKDLDTRIAADEKRQRDLQAIKQQVDQFQQKKAILENKVQRHREAARSPRRVPSTCWTRSRRRCPTTSGSPPWTRPRGNVRFTGQSNSLAAVADFISALQRSGWFPQVGSRLQPGAEQPRELQPDAASSRTLRSAAKEKAAAQAAAAGRPAAARLRGPGRQEGERRWRRIPSPGSPWPASSASSAVIAALICGGFYYFWYSDALEQQKQKEAKLAELQSADPRARGDGQQAAGVPARGPGPRGPARDPEADPAAREGDARPDAARAVPGRPVEPERSGSSPRRAAVQKDFYQEVPINLDVEGTYHNLGRLLRPDQPDVPAREHRQRQGQGRRPARRSATRSRRRRWPRPTSTRTRGPPAAAGPRGGPRSPRPGSARR